MFRCLLCAACTAAAAATRQEQASQALLPKRAPVRLLPASSAAGPRLIYKGERHTGTNFLHALLLSTYANSSTQYDLDHPAPDDMDWCPEWGASPSSTCNHPSQIFPGCHALQGAGPEELFCCWKHGYWSDRCVTEPAASAVLFLVRNPYSFLVALYQAPYE